MEIRFGIGDGVREIGRGQLIQCLGIKNLHSKCNDVMERFMNGSELS